jgi:hypothetical protein
MRISIFNRIPERGNAMTQDYIKFYGHILFHDPVQFVYAQARANEILTCIKQTGWNYASPTIYSQIDDQPFFKG